MRALAAMLLRGGGWARPALVAGCTAIVTSLLMVALSMLLLPAEPREQLFEVVADPGTRGGAAFGAAILTTPLLLLLHQVLRLGQAARHERLAGLRIAGATPREVRLLSAFEVAYPAAVGSVLGVVLFGGLRAVIGGNSYEEVGTVYFGRSLGLVPTSVSPAWWMVLVIVTSVTGVATVLGLRVGRRVSLTPHGLVRREGGARPRPWGLLVLLLAAVVASLVVVVDSSLRVLPAVGALTLTVVALIMLAPWSAYTLGSLVQGRVSSVAALLACRRLVFEPGPAGRAGAAIGGIGLACGVIGALLGDLLASGQMEFFYLFSLALVGACLLAALVVVSLTLAVHSVETVMDRRRSMASLYALGVPAAEVGRSQLWEGLIVALPMSTLGAVLGGAAIAVLGDGGAMAGLGALMGVAVAPLLSLVAVRLAMVITGPVLRRAVAAENLRTA